MIGMLTDRSIAFFRMHVLKNSLRTGIISEGTVTNYVYWDALVTWEIWGYGTPVAQPPLAHVPGESSLALLVSALGGLFVLRRRKTRGDWSHTAACGKSPATM
jgi:MYXO-CTERM domain-containing protein